MEGGGLSTLAPMATGITNHFFTSAQMAVIEAIAPPQEKGPQAAQRVGTKEAEMEVARLTLSQERTPLEREGGKEEEETQSEIGKDTRETASIQVLKEASRSVEVSHKESKTAMQDERNEPDCHFSPPLEGTTDEGEGGVRGRGVDTETPMEEGGREMLQDGGRVEMEEDVGKAAMDEGEREGFTHEGGSDGGDGSVHVKKEALDEGEREGFTHEGGSDEGDGSVHVKKEALDEGEREGFTHEGGSDGGDGSVHVKKEALDEGEREGFTHEGGSDGGDGIVHVKKESVDEGEWKGHSSVGTTGGNDGVEDSDRTEKAAIVGGATSIVGGVTTGDGVCLVKKEEEQSMEMEEGIIATDTKPPLPQLSNGLVFPC